MNSPQIQLLWQRCGVKYLQAENEQQEQIDRKIDQQGDGNMRSQEEIQGTIRARRTIPLQPIKKRHRPPNQPDNAQRRGHDRRVQVIHGHRDQIAAPPPQSTDRKHQTLAQSLIPLYSHQRIAINLSYNQIRTN